MWGFLVLLHGVFATHAPPTPANVNMITHLNNLSETLFIEAAAVDTTTVFATFSEHGDNVPPNGSFAYKWMCTDCGALGFCSVSTPLIPASGILSIAGLSPGISYKLCVKELSGSGWIMSISPFITILPVPGVLELNTGSCDDASCAPPLSRDFNFVTDPYPKEYRLARVPYATTSHVFEVVVHGLHQTRDDVNISFVHDFPGSVATFSGRPWMKGLIGLPPAAGDTRTTVNVSYPTLGLWTTIDLVASRFGRVVFDPFGSSLSGHNALLSGTTVDTVLSFSFLGDVRAEAIIYIVLALEVSTNSSTNFTVFVDQQGGNGFEVWESTTSVVVPDARATQYVVALRSTQAAFDILEGMPVRVVIPAGSLSAARQNFHYLDVNAGYADDFIMEISPPPPYFQLNMRAGPVFYFVSGETQDLGLTTNITLAAIIDYGWNSTTDEMSFSVTDGVFSPACQRSITMRAEPLQFNISTATLNSVVFRIGGNELFSKLLYIDIPPDCFDIQTSTAVGRRLLTSHYPELTLQLRKRVAGTTLQVYPVLPLLPPVTTSPTSAAPTTPTSTPTGTPSGTPSGTPTSSTPTSSTPTSGTPTNMPTKMPTSTPTSAPTSTSMPTSTPTTLATPTVGCIVNVMSVASSCLLVSLDDPVLINGTEAPPHGNPSPAEFVTEVFDITLPVPVSDLPNQTVSFQLPYKADKLALVSCLPSALSCEWWDRVNLLWSDKGCTLTNVAADGGNAGECECDHLTEFAILLRANDRSACGLTCQVLLHQYVVAGVYGILAIVSIVQAIRLCSHPRDKKSSQHSRWDVVLNHHLVMMAVTALRATTVCLTCQVPPIWLVFMSAFPLVLELAEWLFVGLTWASVSIFAMEVNPFGKLRPFFIIGSILLLVVSCLLPLIALFPGISERVGQKQPGLETLALVGSAVMALLVIGVLTPVCLAGCALSKALSGAPSSSEGSKKPNLSRRFANITYAACIFLMAQAILWVVTVVAAREPYYIGLEILYRVCDFGAICVMLAMFAPSINKRCSTLEKSKKHMGGSSSSVELGSGAGSRPSGALGSVGSRQSGANQGLVSASTSSQVGSI